jgi:hypothetical protein
MTKGSWLTLILNGATSFSATGQRINVLRNNSCYVSESGELNARDS